MRARVAKWTSGRADQVLRHRQGECGGVAGSGPVDTEQVVACKLMRDGTCLDGRWVNEVLSVESAQQRLRPRAEKVFDGTKSVLRCPSAHGVTAKTGTLVFAFTRDNGANALEQIFRKGPSSRAGRNANRAITEFDSYIAMTKAEARPCRKFAGPSSCNVDAVPICIGSRSFAVRRRRCRIHLALIRLEANQFRVEVWNRFLLHTPGRFG
jgi:hypothetical protein